MKRMALLAVGIAFALTTIMAVTTGDADAWRRHHKYRRHHKPPPAKSWAASHPNKRTKSYKWCKNNADDCNHSAAWCNNNPKKCYKEYCNHHKCD